MHHIDFKLNNNDRCLCGSGLNHENCCSDNSYDCSLKNEQITCDLINAQKYDKALIRIRNAITSYTILHKKHTEPNLDLNIGVVKSLLFVDIRALTEFIEKMIICYQGLQKTDELIDVLQRLRENIHDNRWQRKITYFQIITRLGKDWSKSIGKQELKKLLPLKDESDSEIIELYLYFYSDEISFLSKLELIEKLIKLADTPGKEFLYKSRKGFYFLINGDTKEAIRILENALDDFEKYNLKNEEIMCIHMRAQVLSWLADLKNSEVLMNKTLIAYNDLLEYPNWSNAGLASIHHEIGECYLISGKIQESIEAFTISNKINYNELMNVLVAKALCEKGDASCLDIINAVQASKLDDNGKIDLAFNYTAIGIEFKNIEMIKNSIPKLKAIKNLDPIFEKHKSELLIKISDYLINGGNTIQRNTLLKAVNELGKVISRYFILQPNFMGLGININNILDDITSNS